jgi:hypothetical protein
MKSCSVRRTKSSAVLVTNEAVIRAICFCLYLCHMSCRNDRTSCKSWKKQKLPSSNSSVWDCFSGTKVVRSDGGHLPDFFFWETVPRSSTSSNSSTVRASNRFWSLTSGSVTTLDSLALLIVSFHCSMPVVLLHNGFRSSEVVSRTSTKY